MAVTRTDLPALKPGAPHAGLLLDHLFMGAWERSANGALQLLNFLRSELLTAEGDYRSLVSLEILATAIELLEYVGSFVGSVLEKGAGRAHQATNKELDEVFHRLVTQPLSAQDVALVLRLPQSIRATNRSGESDLSSVYGRLLEKGSTVLHDVGRFWLEHVDQVRAFRHLPAFLSIEDTLKLAPEPNADRERILAQLKALDNAIVTYVDCDDRELRYRAVTEADVRNALGAAEAAVALLFASFGNALLLPSSPNPGERMRKIPVLLVSGMTDGERTALKEDGEFLIV